MAKRDDKLGRAAHIKQHTVGTSNEISFNVLESLKESVDGTREDVEASRPGRIPIFTLPGRRKKPAGEPKKEQTLPGIEGATASTEVPSAVLPKHELVAQPAAPARSPEEEIAHRKARRRLSRIVAIVVVVVVSVGLLAAGGIYVYRGYQQHQTQVGELDQVFNLIAETDATLLEVDELVSDPFVEGIAERRANVLVDLEETNTQLTQADEQARTVSAEMRDSRDKEAANQAIATVSARFDLVEQGQQLLELQASAQTAVEQTDEAWLRVIEADSLMRDAAALVSDTTTENVQASRQKSSDARTVLSAARDGLVGASATFPQADFSALLSYVDKRIEACDHAIASDDAFLSRNRQDAAASNEAYNVADSEAAALAKTLPEHPSDVVYEAYETVAEEPLQAYSTARLQASTADAFIRDYLGAGSK